MATVDAASLLRTSGLKATPGRTRLIEVLAGEREPRTIEELQAKLGDSLNEVTLYRALDALVKAGIVGRFDFRHGHAHYELAAGRAHHHHVICRECGFVEDIDIPHRTPAADAHARTKGFASVTDYTMEFFGVCTTCAR